VTPGATANAIGDAIMAWLRTPVFPTVLRAELLFSPIILIAFAVALWNLVDSRVSLRHQRGQGRNGGNLMTAKESVRRETFRAARLFAKACMALALVTNWEFLYVVFTLALLFDAWNEAIDSVFVRRFRERIRRYYEHGGSPRGGA